MGLQQEQSERRGAPAHLMQRSNYKKHYDQDTAFQAHVHHIWKQSMPIHKGPSKLNSASVSTMTEYPRCLQVCTWLEAG